MNELAQKVEAAARELISDHLEDRGKPRIDREFLDAWRDHRGKIGSRDQPPEKIIFSAINYAFDQDLQTGTQVLFALKARYQDIYPEAFKSYEQDG